MGSGASPWTRIRRVFGSSRHAPLVLPDFLGIGAQKAGTSWLRANLRRHPELYLPPSELHFFDQHLSRGLAEYSRHFSATEARVKGEITPAYSVLSEDRVQSIRRAMPEVRVLFVMRNPIDRAWSQAMMRLVYIPGRKLEDVSEAELLEQLGSQSSRKRGDYVRTLDTWQSAFPREQLFIGFFEDVHERPQELLGDIFDFLGVTTAVDWSNFPYERILRPGSRRVSPGPPPPIPVNCETFLRELYVDQLAELSERFGERVSGWR